MLTKSNNSITFKNDSGKGNVFELTKRVFDHSLDTLLGLAMKWVGASSEGDLFTLNIHRDDLESFGKVKLKGKDYVGNLTENDNYPTASELEVDGIKVFQITVDNKGVAIFNVKDKDTLEGKASSTFKSYFSKQPKLSNKQFAAIKAQCKTPEQRRAFNRLVQSFSAKVWKNCSKLDWLQVDDKNYFFNDDYDSLKKNGSYRKEINTWLGAKPNEVFLLHGFYESGSDEPKEEFIAKYYLESPIEQDHKTEVNKNETLTFGTINGAKVVILNDHNVAWSNEWVLVNKKDISLLSSY